MSIESKIEALTAAITKLTAAIEAQGTNVPQVAAPVQPAPVVAAPVAPAAPAMPAPPTFAPVAAAPAPVAAPAAPAAPFKDGQGLIQYVMSTYQSMGPEKGAKIQGVLLGLGYVNINDVKPEHYGQLYADVEALKV
jgi:hypothetical protein